AAHAGGPAPGARARIAGADGDPGGRTLPARAPALHAAPGRRAAGLHPGAGGLRSAAQGALARLRDRVVRGAAGHLGGELPRGGSRRAVDARGADRVGPQPGARRASRSQAAGPRPDGARGLIPALPEFRTARFAEAEIGVDVRAASGRMGSTTWPSAW